MNPQAEGHALNWKPLLILQRYGTSLVPFPFVLESRVCEAAPFQNNSSYATNFMDATLVTCLAECLLRGTTIAVLWLGWRGWWR